MQEVPLLSLLVFLPLVGVLLMQVVSSESKTSCRMLSLWFSLMTFGASLALPALYDEQAGGLQLWENAEWIPALGVSYSLAIDGVSLWLIVLTTLTMPITILASWRSVDDRVKSYQVCLLTLEAAILGALVAQNLVLFYLFWEAMLVPMALLIGIWGGGRKVYSAFKFFLFTAAGSLPMLLAILYLWWKVGSGTGVYSFDLENLRQGMGFVPETAAIWCFWAFALAFAVKVPIFPVHTWLPDAHSDAPTGGSVILAGVLLKLGIYGFIRFMMPLFPAETVEYSGVFQILAVIGILYGAFMALAQTDIKRLIAYSSISHLGFCVLGLFALTHHAVLGSVFQMLAHGVSTGALFLLIGVIYDRRHTREISAYGGLANVMPVYARIFLVVTLASIGLPATVGFVGEFLILLGSFNWALAQDPKWWPLVAVIFATTGVILGAMYMLRLYQSVFFGEVRHEENKDLKDVTPLESTSLWPFIVLIFLMGIFPSPFLAEMSTTITQLLDSMPKAGGGF